MSTTPRTLTTEFKLDAITLAKDSSQVEQTARNLGITGSALHRWIREQRQREAQGRPAFTGQGKPARTAQERELQQLRKELEITRQERDMLKKAVAFFAKESK